MTFKQIAMMLIDSMQVAVLLVFISMVIGYFYKKCRRETLQSPVRIATLLLYLYMLLYVTVFRGGLFQNTYHVINLVPFDELITSSYYQLQVWGEQSAFLLFSYNVLGNIIWFLPLGILLPTLKETMKLGKVTFLSFLLSFFIEVSQYVFYTGISDIDDIIFNVLGGVLGYAMYHFLVVKEERKEYVCPSKKM